MCPPRSPENIGVNPFRALVYHFGENPFVAGNFLFFFFFCKTLCRLGSPVFCRWREIIVTVEIIGLCSDIPTIL